MQIHAHALLSSILFKFSRGPYRLAKACTLASFADCVAAFALESLRSAWISPVRTATLLKSASFWAKFYARLASTIYYINR